MRIIVILLFTVVAGCAGRVYDYSSSADSPAILKGYSKRDGFSIRNIWLLEADKNKLGGFVKNSVKLNPGRHIIYYAFENNDSQSAIGRFDIELKSAATYYCDASVDNVTKWVTFNLIEESTGEVAYTTGADVRPRMMMIIM